MLTSVLIPPHLFHSLFPLPLPLSLSQVSFYDVNASLEPGQVLGEHALMTDGCCACTYRASTRCELFTFGIDDLYKITCTLKHEQQDEMAELIYETYARRKLLRALSLRFYFNALCASSSSETSRETIEALRIQTRWFQRAARQAVALQRDSQALPSLLPAIYSKAFRSNTRRPKSRERPAESQAFFEAGRSDAVRRPRPSKEAMGGRAQRPSNEAMGGRVRRPSSEAIGSNGDLDERVWLLEERSVLRCTHPRH